MPATTLTDLLVGLTHPPIRRWTTPPNEDGTGGATAENIAAAVVRLTRQHMVRR